MSYKAPTEDILFALIDVVGLDRLKHIEALEDANEDTLRAIVSEGAKFAESVLAPLNVVGDKHPLSVKDGEVRTVPGWREAFSQFADSGWTTLSGSPDFGGQGLPSCFSTAVNELWDTANMAFGLCNLLTSGAVEAIEHHASDDLKHTYLPPMIEGRWTGTMNLTEPQAGSDLAAIRTKAVLEGNHYRISGQKIFITYGEHDLTENIVHLVLARTPDAPAGVKGISLFVVPKFLVNPDGSLGDRNDLRCVSCEHKLGIHASPTCVMSYGDQSGAIGYLVGEENQGLSYMFTMMNLARHAVGRQGYAIAERAYQAAVYYAKDRTQGKPMLAPEGSKNPGIIHHPDIRRTLLNMRSQIEAMRMLAMECAVNFDLAAHHPDESQRQQNLLRGELLNPLVKGWSTEIGVLLCSDGVQVHGGMGFIEETGAAQHYRDARITTIYEGTTAIQANDLIGRKLGRDHGETLKQWFAELRQCAAQCPDTQHSSRQQFEAALSVAEQASDWVLAHPKQAKTYAVSVPYLMLLGTLAGGWMQLKAAQAALAPQRDLPEAFRQAKLHSARYYQSHVLAQVHAEALRVMQSADDILAYPEQDF